MALVEQILIGYDGFAISYDNNEKPFFLTNIMEDMKLIKEVAIGVQLLAGIAAARPAKREITDLASGEIKGKGLVFPAGVNVLITPVTRQFVQSGHKLFSPLGMGTPETLVKAKPTEKKYFVTGQDGKPIEDKDKCAFYALGGSRAIAGDPVASDNGTGSVSVMRYTNAQVMTSKGEWTRSFIVLAHELIHCLHHVTGTRKNDGEEEWTTGINLYADEPMSENGFRKAVGMPTRHKY